MYSQKISGDQAVCCFDFFPMYRIFVLCDFTIIVFVISNYQDFAVRRLASRSLARLIQPIPDFSESYVLPSILKRLEPDSRGLQTSSLDARHGAMYAIAEMVRYARSRNIFFFYSKETKPIVFHE